MLDGVRAQLVDDEAEAGIDRIDDELSKTKERIEALIGTAAGLDIPAKKLTIGDPRPSAKELCAGLLGGQWGGVEWGAAPRSASHRSRRMSVTFSGEAVVVVRGRVAAPERAIWRVVRLGGAPSGRCAVGRPSVALKWHV